MHYSERMPGSLSTSLPTLRPGGRGRGSRSDHACGGGRMASSIISRPARKAALAPTISLAGNERRGRMQKLIHAIVDNSLLIVLPSAPKLTTRIARPWASRSLSAHSSFRPNSGRQVCKPSSQIISRPRFMSSSPSLYVCRTRRNRSQLNQAMKRLER
jgi:hypothetical protein